PLRRVPPEWRVLPRIRRRGLAVAPARAPRTRAPRAGCGVGRLFADRHGSLRSRDLLSLARRLRDARAASSAAVRLSLSTTAPVGAVALRGLLTIARDPHAVRALPVLARGVLDDALHQHDLPRASHVLFRYTPRLRILAW